MRVQRLSRGPVPPARPPAPEPSAWGRPLDRRARRKRGRGTFARSETLALGRSDFAEGSSMGSNERDDSDDPGHWSDQPNHRRGTIVLWVTAIVLTAIGIMQIPGAHR